LKRVSIGPSGEMVFGRNVAGRGAWLCAGSVRCLENALRKGSLARALRTELDCKAEDRLRSEL